METKAKETLALADHAKQDLERVYTISGQRNCKDTWRFWTLSNSYWFTQRVEGAFIKRNIHVNSSTTSAGRAHKEMCQNNEAFWKRCKPYRKKCLGQMNRLTASDLKPDNIFGVLLKRSIFLDVYKAQWNIRKKKWCVLCFSCLVLALFIPLKAY